MDDLEINDYLRRALESAGGQFSELSFSHHEDESVFLTDRPLTPRTSEKRSPVKCNVNINSSDYRLKQIKVHKAGRLVSEACEEMKRSNFKMAQAKLTRAIQMNGENANYYMLRGECSLQLCDFNASITNYQYAINITVESVSEWESRLAFIHFLYSQILYDEQSYQDALSQVDSALKYKPKEYSYQCRRVTYLYALRQHKQCLQNVEVLLQEVDDAELYILRARLNKLFGNITNCFYDVHKALELDPNIEQAKQIVTELNMSAEECRTAAVNYALNGDIAEGISKITISIDTNPTIANYNVFRGTLLRQQGNYNEAIDDFMTALTKTSGDESGKLYQDTLRQLVLTYNDFALECYTKGYYEEAISLLDQSIKRERNEKGFYMNRGDSFRMTGYLTFALADYQQALELDPHDWVIISRISLVHHQYGVTEYSNKRYSDAETCFTTAITCNSKIAQYYNSRAWARFMQKHLPAARADLIRALYLDSSIEEGIMLSARLYPNQNVDSILNANSSQKILNQMKELVAGEQDSVVLSSNTLAHEPLAEENIAQFNTWMTRYKASNNSVKTILDSRLSLSPTVPKVISQEKINNQENSSCPWMKKYFDSSAPNSGKPVRNVS